MKKHRLNLAIKCIAVTVIILIVLYFIIGYIERFLETSDYFKVKDIKTRPANMPEISYLKGKNTFSVNLKNEAGYILESFPDCSKIKLARVLPSRIFVDFIKRKPLALVKLYRYFTLDEDGVLFYAPGQPETLESPIIPMRDIIISLIIVLLF